MKSKYTQLELEQMANYVIERHRLGDERATVLVIMLASQLDMTPQEVADKISALARGETVK